MLINGFRILENEADYQIFLLQIIYYIDTGSPKKIETSFNVLPVGDTQRNLN